MKIYIKYNNKKISINTDIYQSIKSIIYYYLEQNNINNDVDNFFLDYNGKYIDSNFSLEKYKIKNNSILNLNKKVKGGNSFIQYAKKNPKQVIICILNLTCNDIVFYKFDLRIECEGTRVTLQLQSAEIIFINFPMPRAVS